MITRITGATQLRSAQLNLQNAAQQLQRLQDQATTRKTIGRPSDDPTGTAAALTVRSDAAAAAQFSRNADNGDAWLTTIDSSLTSAEQLMRKIRDLTVQGSNDGSMSAPAKEAIATELDGLRDDLLNLANTQLFGRSVFAGNSDDGVAFDPSYAFTGAPGSTVERRVSPTTTVRVDADGAAVFGTGADSVFALVDGIAADLRAGVNVSSRLDQIDVRMSAIVGEHADVGVRQSRLDRAKESLMEQSTQLEAQRSGIEDIDLGSVILQLQTQNVNYQAALGVTARVLQPSLMDFLR